MESSQLHCQKGILFLPSARVTWIRFRWSTPQRSPLVSTLRDLSTIADPHTSRYDAKALPALCQIRDSNAPSTSLQSFLELTARATPTRRGLSEIIGGKARFQPCQTVQGDQASARHSLRLTIFGLNLLEYCASHARLTRN
jgi:hypothetical protein